MTRNERIARQTGLTVNLITLRRDEYLGDVTDGEWYENEKYRKYEEDGPWNLVKKEVRLAGQVSTNVARKVGGHDELRFSFVHQGQCFSGIATPGPVNLGHIELSVQGDFDFD